MRILIVRDSGFIQVALNKRYSLINGIVTSVLNKEIKQEIPSQEVFSLIRKHDV